MQVFHLHSFKNDKEAVKCSLLKHFSNGSRAVIPNVRLGMEKFQSRVTKITGTFIFGTQVKGFA